ncbi:MAG TPA: FHA domain-containing protein [Kofleriaceae bacterium]
MSSRYLLVLLLTLFCTTRIARAGENSVEVYLQVKAPDQTDAKQKGKAPKLEATIIGGPNVPVEKFSISTTNKNQKVTLKADKRREYSEGTETITIGLVINGQMIWIGNDDYETDENAKYAGVLKSLEQAIDKLQLGKAGPPGSKGFVVSYSTGAEIKVPTGDLTLVTGGALGGQKDYQNKIGNDLVQGISTAMAELSKVSTARKALIIVGDGNDTNNDIAKAQLKDYRDQARKQNIQLFAIIYKSAVSSEGAVITTMIPGAKTVNSIDGIASELNAIIARMADRYYLEFPGYDATLKQGLPWDGKEHDLTIKIDQTELEPVTLTLAPVWNPPKAGGFPWLVLILVIVGLLLLIIIGVKVFGSKPVEAPAPMAMPMPMATAEPPKPAGPAKTVMLNAGGDSDGFPIVGWIVAMNGVDAYKTQRLKTGVTKIGTAPPADIVVNDGFMSTDHCQVVCSPAGFTVIDNGATNGTYVNDRKIQKHELVDNDVITLGKTNFKFKSIN